jgi:hypothetical protein
MGRLSAKLRSVDGGVAHWCPACDEAHVYQVPRWTFNGDAERPTLTPSMLIRWGRKVPGYENADMPEGGICHYFLTEGRLHFQGDCTHALSGQIVDLPDWPTAHEFWNEERPSADDT